MSLDEVLQHQLQTEEQVKEQEEQAKKEHLIQLNKLIENLQKENKELNENLVKKRSDIGVIKIPEINEHNDRVKNINPLPETFDPLIPLNPNIEAVKPNV